MPHHPGNLLIPPVHIQTGKQRLKVLAAHQLIRCEPERVEVAMWADDSELIRDNFRSDVLRRSLHHAAVVTDQPPRDAKITKFDSLVAINKQIAGLDISMHDTVLVHRLKRVQGVVQREPKILEIDPTTAEQVGQ